MRYTAVISIIILFTQLAGAQSSTDNKSNEEPPRLVVGIVVDQMRYDYLSRFQDRFGEQGFKRLMKDGFVSHNTHFNYMPTSTAPGHAAIFTGTTPSLNGIIGNNWYDKLLRRNVYNAEDASVKGLGTDDEAGRMSPSRLLSGTVTDALKLHTQHRAKVVGVSIKDRGAILPAGHMADMAFWYHGGDHGHFISSTYYDEQLPSWAAEFNKTNPSQKYLNTWETLYPIDTYTASGADRNDYERPFSGIEQAVFPYDLEKLAPKNGGFSILKATPYGNTLVTDFALEALKGEEMGTDDIPDFLTVSYSSTDYIGHQFGVNSVEVEDTYLRLDREIERLLKALDKQVGDGNYTVFLTADHAAIHVPQYLKDHGMQAGYVDGDAFAKAITEEIEAEFDTSGIIEKVKGYNIYLDRKTLRENNIKYTEAEAFLAEIVQQQPSIYSVFTRTALMNGSFTDPIGTKVSNGFHPQRSGDLVFIPDPGYIDYPEVGSTHGSPMNYDSHVPLLFYGKGVNAGVSYERYEITDIAPTVSAILGIAQPTACTGNPITEVLD